MIIPQVKKINAEVKISDIIFDSEFYARFEPDQKLLADYQENIDQIINSENRIHISQDNILIDGYHRWKAAERVHGKDFVLSVIKHETTNKDYILLESSSANTRHGQRNKKTENVRNVRRLYVRGFTLEQIQEKTGLGKSLVYAATSDDRKREKEERDQKIVDLYLKAENTQEAIAELMEITQPSVKSIVENIKNSTHGIFYKTFKPLLYNIWNTPKGDDNNHFGHFPAVFMENLLHYHTEPLDIVFDPFAGSGTTVDVCKSMFRRYYCSDRKVQPGREQDIKEHDIKAGVPVDLPKPAIAFLDPPYWKQAEGKYSDDTDDLGNMDITDFNNAMAGLLKALSDWKVERIAIVIQPTQWKNNMVWIDHIFDFHAMLTKYRIEQRYILPYSTEQYNPQMVEKAKELNQCLCLNRDLVVWRLNNGK